MPLCPNSFYVSMTKARVIGDKGAPIEKITTKDQVIGKAGGPFIILSLMVEGLAYCGWKAHRRVGAELIRLLKASSPFLYSLNKIKNTGGKVPGHTGSESLRIPCI